MKLLIFYMDINKESVALKKLNMKNMENVLYQKDGEAILLNCGKKRNNFCQIFFISISFYNFSMKKTRYFPKLNIINELI